MIRGIEIVAKKSSEVLDTIRDLDHYANIAIIPYHSYKYLLICNPVKGRGSGSEAIVQLRQKPNCPLSRTLGGPETLGFVANNRALYKLFRGYYLENILFKYIRLTLARRI